MITLYGAASAASTVVHWLLIELGLPHELKLFDIDRREHRTPEYLKLNPAGTVPTLVLGGLVLTETAAIAMHLGDLHPERALAPAVGTAERAIYYQWMFFMANTVQPAYRAWFYPNEPAGARAPGGRVGARRRASGSATRGERRALHAGGASDGGRFPDDDPDALGAQDAPARRDLAGAGGVRAADEVAALVQGSLRA
jgi:glutathione S-transferase